VKGIAFKEWAIVCEALGAGRQCILLRKGGIAEGRDGFQFKHREFFLFPTFFHEQLARTTLPAGTAEPVRSPGVIEIKQFARMEWARTITDPQVLSKLTPFHILSEEVIEERFEYDEPKGINIACVRVYNLTSPATFLDAPGYGGCRSWVAIPEIASEKTAAMDDGRFRHAAEELSAIFD
jgi:hypothetical protein